MSLHHCGSDHQGNELAAVRCEYHRLLLDGLQEYAATLDKHPTAVQVADLWAHARTIRDDGAEAARWVRQVLDLGWRPAVTP